MSRKNKSNTEVNSECKKNRKPTSIPNCADFWILRVFCYPEILAEIKLGMLGNLATNWISTPSTAFGRCANMFLVKRQGQHVT